jgi:hypothetical protein
MFPPEGVVARKGRFYKIDPDTFRNFDSNVIDTNIKLYISLQLCIK